MMMNQQSDSKNGPDCSDDAAQILRDFIRGVRDGESLLRSLNELMTRDHYLLEEDQDHCIRLPAAVIHPYLKKHAERIANELITMYATCDRLAAVIKALR